MSQIIEFPGVNPEAPIKAREYSRGNQRNTSYSFRLAQFDTLSLPRRPRTEYEIRLEFQGNWYTQVRNIRTGSTKLVTEKQTSYLLIIRNEMTFGESIAFFRKLGVAPDTKIWNLHYGDNHIENMDRYSPETKDMLKKAKGEDSLNFVSKSTRREGSEDEESFYHQTPFTFADVDAELIQDVNSCKGYILFSWDGNGTALDGFGFSYEQRHEDDIDDGSNEITLEKRVREIYYASDTFNEDIFRAFLGLSVNPVSKEEAGMLKDVIKLHLRRFYKH